MKTKKLDKKYFGRGETPDTFEIMDARGSIIYDTKGKKYIDFVMGWSVGNVGWENEEIKSAVETFKGPEYVHPYLFYKPWAKLAKLLAEITPGKLQVSYRTTGGTEAIEAALQMAMLYTKRSKFLSIEGSYHGNSIAAFSIGDSKSSKQFKNHLHGCEKLDPPLNMHTALKAETILKKRETAAFIMEPVICNLGVLVPDREFMRTMQKLCNKYGTLFIMDEVATGFGRTGKLFASEHFGLDPDILCVAKAVSGGYGGLGAAITTEKIAGKVKKHLNIYSTYGWHPLSVNAAIANIHYIMKNKEKLLDHVLQLEQYFTGRLTKMKYKHETKVHVKGLAISIDLGKAAYAKKVHERCLDKGLYLHVQGKELVMFPAMNIPNELVKKGLDILEECI